MIYTVQHFCDVVHVLAPPSLSMEWDNSGLLVGSGEATVNRAMVALDATCAVIGEAMALDAQLIVAHHPIIMNPLRRVPVESAVYQAISAGIAVLCAHTNLDIAKGGVNDALANRIGLKNTEILSETQSKPYFKVCAYVPRESVEALCEAMEKAGAGKQDDYEATAFLAEGKGRFRPLEGANPVIGQVGELEIVDETRLEMLVAPADLPEVLLALREAHPYEQPAYDVFETRFDAIREGLGRVGDLPEAMTPEALALHVGKSIGAAGLKYVPGEGVISRVAVCGGSGADFLGNAIAAGAQALITADTKHHQLLEAKEKGFTLIDAGHHATEAVVLPILADALRSALPGAEIVLTARGVDPARYLTR